MTSIGHSDTLQLCSISVVCWQGLLSMIVTGLSYFTQVEIFSTMESAGREHERGFSCSHIPDGVSAGEHLKSSC